ncbi:MAG: glycosyltransferase [Calditrichia bacterium]
MKKVLVISYYWPPAGGPGAQRVVKFVKYLPMHGWQPIVLTVEKGEFPYTDESLGTDLPEDLPVFRSRALDPFRFYKAITGKKGDEAIPVGYLTQSHGSFKEKLAAYIRSNLFVPDARVGWNPYAIRRAERIIREEQIDLVFTSTPPHSTNLIGRYLNRKLRIPWVADFRDPWTDIRYYKFLKRWKITAAYDARLERICIEQADAVTTVSRALMDQLAQKTTPPCPEKFYIIPNGFDEADFENIATEPGTRFTILHTGNMQAHQNPEALWQALAELREEQPELAAQIRVKLVGRTHPEVENTLKRLQLESIVEFSGFVPHNQIPPMLRSAELLLMVIPKVEDNLGIVTGKFFEYLGSNRPILVVGPPQSDAGQILKGLSGSAIFDYDAVHRLKKYLQDALQSWQRNQWQFDNQHKVARYSRRALAGKLAEVFEGVSLKSEV